MRNIISNILLIIFMLFITQVSKAEPQYKDYSEGLYRAYQNEYRSHCLETGLYKSETCKKNLNRLAKIREEMEKARPELIEKFKAAEAYNCPEAKKYVQNDKFKILTVKGETYYQAKYELDKQMPHIGFDQTIKYEEVKKMSSISYREKATYNKKLEANVDSWITYNCKHQGEFYITAVVPKENINYTGDWWTNDPAFQDINKLRKLCKKGEKITLLGDPRSDTYDISKKPVKKSNGRKYDQPDPKNKKDYWHVYCGEFNIVRVDQYRYTSVVTQITPIWNSRMSDRNFNAFRLGYGYLEDVTVEVWNQLMKNQ